MKTQFDILNVMEVELMYKSKMALVIMVLVQIPTAVVTCASLPEALWLYLYQPHCHLCHIAQSVTFKQGVLTVDNDGKNGRGLFSNL